MYRVICPALGYMLNCGKGFEFEGAAIAFVLRLRNRGLIAWIET
jgi:hypothetical protein